MRNTCGFLFSDGRGARDPGVACFFRKRMQASPRAVPEPTRPQRPRALRAWQHQGESGGGSSRVLTRWGLFRTSASGLRATSRLFLAAGGRRLSASQCLRANSLLLLPLCAFPMGESLPVTRSHRPPPGTPDTGALQACVDAGQQALGAACLFQVA